ncbi:IclR family transcriptional regulator [Arcticibacter sp.]|jgi:DNA-binding IclR family transcriptional regulator|uniref:IclR family transcriptional regulator n=1 Tax=Arcticibacter sp. TaxID=1872630 RepID=UPI00388D7197
MKEKESKYNAPALDKGLDILEYLSSQSTPQSQTEIAAGIDKNANEIYRMLTTLEARNYILRDEISGKYRLSLKLYHLSHRHSPIDELRKAARYPIEELAYHIRQSCHMSILYMSKVLVIMHAKSPEPIALSVEEGNTFPLSLTASGKVFLAYMSDSVLKESLHESNLDDVTKSQPENFFDTLKKIKKDGYYIKRSELAEGVVDIAVPVSISAQGVTACLTVSRLTTLNMNKGIENDEILAEALKCAEKIRSRIGQTTPF